jgi:hypothetical protein
MEVRNANGQMYPKNTFVGIRASISKHLRAHPFNKTFYLVTDKEFYKSNQMFLAMKQKIKREGPDAIKHHPHITDEDFEKLKNVLLKGCALRCLLMDALIPTKVFLGYI